MESREAGSKGSGYTVAIVVVAAVGLLGCMHQPQTRGEFVKVVAGGAATTDKETAAAAQDIESLVMLLEERAKACLAKRIERSGMVGGQLEVSATEYRPSVTRISDTRAEFTLQLEHSPRGIGPDMPKGGFYMMAADLVGEAPRQTRVDIYYATMAKNSDEILDAVRAWTSGKTAECPALD